MSKFKENLELNNGELQKILNTINALPETGGVELPELINEGTAADLLTGKQLINQDGEIVEGTMPNNGEITTTFDGIDSKSFTIPSGYTSGGTVSLDNTIDNEVTEQADLIAQIAAVVDDKAGNSIPLLQDKTITTNGVYMADDGYDGLGNVTVNVAGTTDQEINFLLACYTLDYNVYNMHFINGWTWNDYIDSNLSCVLLIADGSHYRQLRAEGLQVRTDDEYVICSDSAATIPVKPTDLIEADKIYTSYWDD